MWPSKIACWNTHPKISLHILLEFSMQVTYLHLFAIFKNLLNYKLHMWFFNIIVTKSKNILILSNWYEYYSLNSIYQTLFLTTFHSCWQGSRKLFSCLPCFHLVVKCRSALSLPIDKNARITLVNFIIAIMV